jgi:hypothetical protein
VISRISKLQRLFFTTEIAEHTEVRTLSSPFGWLFHKAASRAAARKLPPAKPKKDWSLIGQYLCVLRDLCGEKRRWRLEFLECPFARFARFAVDPIRVLSPFLVAVSQGREPRCGPQTPAGQTQKDWSLIGQYLCVLRDLCGEKRRWSLEFLESPFARLARFAVDPKRRKSYSRSSPGRTTARASLPWVSMTIEHNREPGAT